ncbi:peptidoglycan DD-metalloendopeptidase family protein [Cognatiyoonia sp. IB215446]|uniref:murein hydrolase activator EnvC family protein n=1 Tax=Cognatiyoonia sp. IB215446 TaxID=3097355 RepID=UPI002A100477|nr:peptidoglycan DD-metalloendopeptidase family protein [Cognatiyoonia sp. IB215446]MDX8346738.1 peptidoglycan DD-metalloendopeptidase family protein [Cognatiyoonia sp. IB215446]
MRWVALLWCLASPLAAQEQAQEAARQLQAANARLEAADTARDRIRALTETVQAYEAGLIAMRDGLRQITVQETEISDKLAEDREDLARLLGVLSSISKTPDPVILSHPQGARNAARAGMLTTDMTLALEEQVDALREQLRMAQSLRAARADATNMLQEGLVGAQEARVALGQAVSDRVTLPRRFEQDPVQTALLVASAQTLADFAAELTSATPSPENTLTASGDLPLPVAGIVLPDQDPNLPGIHVGAAPQALVSTPVDATILFEGPLLNYGTVVILEPTAGVLFIFAGLGTVFVQPGEIVSADAPIGLLGGAASDVDGILTENDASNAGQAQQVLYLEVRDRQSAVSPDAWFALE